MYFLFALFQVGTTDLFSVESVFTDHVLKGQPVASGETCSLVNYVFIQHNIFISVKVFCYCILTDNKIYTIIQSYDFTFHFTSPTLLFLIMDILKMAKNLLL